MCSCRARLLIVSTLKTATSPKDDSLQRPENEAAHVSHISEPMSRPNSFRMAEAQLVRRSRYEECPIA